MTAEKRVIDFMKTRRLTGIISLTLVLGSLLTLAINGLNLGAGFHRRHAGRDWFQRAGAIGGSA